MEIRPIKIDQPTGKAQCLLFLAVKTHQIVAAVVSLYFITSAFVPRIRLPVGHSSWGFTREKGFHKFCSNWTKLPMLSCLGIALFMSTFALGDRMGTKLEDKLGPTPFVLIAVGFVVSGLIDLWPARVVREQRTRRLTRRDRKERRQRERLLAKTGSKLEK